MNTMQLVGRICSVILVGGAMLSSSHADEIVFKNDKNPKTGTVLRIEQDSVTIRFPRESIKSIIMTREGAALPKKGEISISANLTDSQLQESLEGIQERIRNVEKNLEDKEKSMGTETQSPTKPVLTHEKLLKEEMGSIQGIIEWRGKPLKKGRVKIVLEKYMGFSLASVRRVFTSDTEGTSGEEITLTGQTDSQGLYSFSNVPPGYYRLYWMPDGETNWYHRFRDTPDFEVISGKLTVQNIPERN